MTEEEKIEEAEIPKDSTISVWTAKPGKILETERTFYFTGGQEMIMKNIIEIGVADDLTRIVTKDNHIYLVYHSNLLGVEIVPPPKACPLLGA